MAPIQTIPTLNQNGMNIAVSSFVQGVNTQKTAQTQGFAKELEHELTQDKANIQVLKEAGQVGTLTASAIVNPYNEDEDRKEQEFEEQNLEEELSEDLEDELLANEEDDEQYEENPENQDFTNEYSMQDKENHDERLFNEENTNQILLGNVLNIKV